MKAATRTLLRIVQPSSRKDDDDGYGAIVARHREDDECLRRAVGFLGYHIVDAKERVALKDLLRAMAGQR